MSGAKSDGADAHMLTDMVRTDSHQLRAVAGDSPDAAAVKVVARTHKTLIWERTRQVQRLRYQLREYFPAALAAFEDLDAPDALELLTRAPDPARARRLTRAQVSAALKRARGLTSALAVARQSEAPVTEPARPRIRVSQAASSQRRLAAGLAAAGWSAPITAGEGQSGAAIDPVSCVSMQIPRNSVYEAPACRREGSCGGVRAARTGPCPRCYLEILGQDETGVQGRDEAVDIGGHVGLGQALEISDHLGQALVEVVLELLNLQAGEGP